MSNLISLQATPADGYTEPVTLDDVKSNIILDFTDLDSLITAWITSERQRCEKILGLSLIDTDIKALYQAHGFHKHRYSLYYGPITTNDDGPIITGLPDDAVVKGYGTDIWVETWANELDLSYSASWGESIPEWAKQAIYLQIAWRIEHRGDESISKISPEAMEAMNPYRINVLI